MVRYYAEQKDAATWADDEVGRRRKYPGAFCSGIFSDDIIKFEKVAAHDKGLDGSIHALK